MIIKILALALITEALVEIFFKAAPLQGARRWLVKKTPVLRSADQGHLMDCPYCMSIWIGAGVVLIATFADCQITRLGAAALLIARLSNYAHLLFSSIRDVQINKRLKRRCS